ncbi:AEC family transporter [Candidatus Oleimmundimicrobium sp.]|uniref:AEC family transporter n=1 Tax=Candidatus Oleimmundimicrobium sp. TaxID=3060597 RepID=UPI00271FA0E1|nr:AEC family transporter [Candidatus Oleimmundimicrobium sp.]MDO8886577.1 AEC family transporter [Candidatus Oleimmundimicrobium sp.]
MDILSLFGLILSAVTLIALGYLSKVTGLLKHEDSTILNNVIIYLALPALIFLAIRNSQISINLLSIPLVGWVVMLSCAATAFFITRLLPLKNPTVGAFLLAAAIGNTGYLGYPLTLGLLGEEALAKAIFYDIFGTVIFAFTIGLYFAEVYGTNGKKINKIKEVVTFPPLIALFVGLFFRGVVLPLFILKSLNYLSAAAIPLIMLSIGLSLRFDKLGQHKLLIVLLCGIKLILSPMLAYIVGNLANLSAGSLSVVVLETSMPAAMLSFIIGLKYGLDADFLSVAIVSATVLSMITIPIWQYIIAII